MIVYYYLHENGELIEKPTGVVDSMGPFDYFDSPFVVRRWLVNPDVNGKNFLKEAAKSGANPLNIKTIKELWKLQ